MSFPGSQFLIIGFITLVLSLPVMSVQEVAVLGEEELEELLTERHGKITVINVWATWCQPCREEFPDLIKLAEFYRNSSVKIVSISADYSDEIDSKIKPFLNKFRVNFPVFVQDFPDTQHLIERLNPEWSGALPATFIYDGRGMLRSFILGKKDFTFFKDEIETVRRNGRYR